MHLDFGRFVSMIHWQELLAGIGYTGSGGRSIRIEVRIPFTTEETNDSIG